MDIRRTDLSREAVAKSLPSGAQAQSQMIRPWLLSAAIATNPLSSCNSNSLHVRSRDTDSTSLSSGWNAMRVTVRTWPGNGCPNKRKVSASYTLTVAWSAEVALQAVAMNLRVLDTASEIDCITGISGIQGGCLKVKITS